MLPVLEDYLALARAYPDGEALSKAKRKARHAALMAWEKRAYQCLADAGEIAAFMETYPELRFGRPFYKKVLTPCVQKDLENGGTEGLHLLFELTERQGDAVYPGTDRDPVCIFCEAVGWTYDHVQLADRLLAKEPDNQMVLAYKYQVLAKEIANTIHEVPWVILNGMNGASAASMPYLDETLTAFEQTGRALGRDDGRWVAYCRRLYKAWEGYLNEQTRYESFQDYLEKQQIPYEYAQ